MKIFRDIEEIESAVAEGKADTALSLSKQLKEAYPTVAKAQVLAGTVFYEQENYSQAVECFAKVLILKSGHSFAKEYLLYSMFMADKIEASDLLATAFLKLIIRPDGLNIDLVTKVWIDFLHDTSKFNFEEITSKGYQDFKIWVESLSFDQRESVFSDILIYGMVLKTVPDMRIERFLTYCRRFLLEFSYEHKNLAIKSSISKYSKLSVSLAQCCFNNSYVFEVSQEEEVLLQKFLAQDLGELEVLDVAMIASYVPLYSLEKLALSLTRMFSPISGRGVLKPIIAQQIIEPKSHKKYFSKMKFLSDVDNKKSKDVCSQYEENPYPRWHILNAVHKDDIEEVIFDDMPFKKDFLIAGCQTGAYPINIALSYPACHVTGMDTNPSNLSYAQYKADEFKIRNLEFISCDILDVSALGKSFDVIHSVGALNHIKGPKQGLDCLLSVLKPDGYIKIGLYSKAARRYISACQKDLIKMGLNPDINGIKAARRYIFSLPADHPYHKMEEYTDFYNAFMTRDMLFSVQENCFEINQLQKIISAGSLEFLGFSGMNFNNAKNRFLKKHPNERDLLDLEKWDKFELENPDTFIGMYNFWCRKQS